MSYVNGLVKGNRRLWKYIVVVYIVPFSGSFTFVQFGTYLVGDVQEILIVALKFPLASENLDENWSILLFTVNNTVTTHNNDIRLLLLYE